MIQNIWTIFKFTIKILRESLIVYIFKLKLKFSFYYVKTAKFPIDYQPMLIFIIHINHIVIQNKKIIYLKNKGYHKL